MELYRISVGTFLYTYTYVNVLFENDLMMLNYDLTCYQQAGILHMTMNFPGISKPMQIRQPSFFLI